MEVHPCYYLDATDRGINQRPVQYMSYSENNGTKEQAKGGGGRAKNTSFFIHQSSYFLCLPYLATTLLVQNMFIDRQQFASEGFQVAPGHLPGRRNAASFRQA